MTYQFPPFRPWRARIHCQILSQASVVPHRRVTNQEIIDDYGHKVVDAIVRRSVGVETRHVAGPEVSDSDLLAEAARDCLCQAGLPVERISKLIVTKFLGDRILPPTASIVQRRLGSKLAIQCLDIDGGSHAFLQALDLGARCIASGDQYILIASGGVCNGLVSRTDPRLAFLYGDGAACVLLGPSNEQHFLGSYFFSNPDYLDLHRGVQFQDTASIDRSQDGQETKLRDLLRMGNWKDSAGFVLQAAETTCTNLLNGAAVGLEQIERFLVSESNGPLWKSILERLAIPLEKTVSLLRTQGNTMSANVPMLLCAAEHARPSRTGDHTLFLSIGEGISGGGILYQT